MHPALLPLFAPQVQGLPDQTSFPTIRAALAARVRGPVLIVQGERDLQVGVADVRRAGRGRPEAKLVMIPGANHVLKAVASDDRAANFATYADPALPLAPGIADAIAAFVTRQAAALMNSVFEALAHPTRRAILEMLKSGSKTRGRARRRLRRLEADHVGAFRQAQGSRADPGGPARRDDNLQPQSLGARGSAARVHGQDGGGEGEGE